MRACMPLNNVWPSSHMHWSLTRQHWKMTAVSWSGVGKLGQQENYNCGEEPSLSNREGPNAHTCSSIFVSRVQLMSVMRQSGLQSKTLSMVYWDPPTNLGLHFWIVTICTWAWHCDVMSFGCGIWSDIAVHMLSRYPSHATRDAGGFIIGITWYEVLRIVI